MLIHPGNYISIETENSAYDVVEQKGTEPQLAINALETLEIKGRASKTGYERSKFGNGWSAVGGCDMRNNILARDMTNLVVDENCLVLSGELIDPYSNQAISFHRGPNSSSLVQIDHIVSLSDAWQKGAQNLSYQRRVEFANDPLELIAVDGRLNEQKSDSDVASWLPPYEPFRCQFIARQVAVKHKYDLWVTRAEFDMMKRILTSCPSQRLPLPSVAPNG